MFANRTLRYSLATVTAVFVLCVTLPATAHEHPARHSHLATSNQPRIQLDWYQDLVYDADYHTPWRTSLDVYVPDPADAPAPVVLFVHGGGWRGSDKAYYKDLGAKPAWFTTVLGYVFVSMNHRFLPDGGYPGSFEDVAKALAWIHDNIAEYGGDPERIVLFGHATGAIQTSLVATDAAFLNAVGHDISLIKGVICVDVAYYDLVGLEGAGVIDRAFPADPAIRRRASPIHNIEPNKGIAPFLILYGGAGGAVRTQSEAMATALRAADIDAAAIEFPAKDHFTANEHIGRPGDASTIVVERFLESLDLR
jgi:arylformamidase